MNTNKLNWDSSFSFEIKKNKNDDTFLFKASNIYGVFTGSSYCLENSEHIAYKKYFKFRSCKHINLKQIINTQKSYCSSCNHTGFYYDFSIKCNIKNCRSAVFTTTDSFSLDPSYCAIHLIDVLKDKIKNKEKRTPLDHEIQLRHNLLYVNTLLKLKLINTESTKLNINFYEKKKTELSKIINEIHSLILKKEFNDNITIFEMLKYQELSKSNLEILYNDAILIEVFLRGHSYEVILNTAEHITTIPEEIKKQ